MTVWALCQSSSERIFVPAMSLSLTGRFMPRLMTSEKLSPGSFALLRSWYTSSEMAMVLAMTSGWQDLLYMHSYTKGQSPRQKPTILAPKKARGRGSSGPILVHIHVAYLFRELYLLSYYQAGV